MGGGGFMQHASDTNRKDMAQKVARREKFNGNHSDKTTLDGKRGIKLDFSHLTQDQISKERIRIKTEFKQRKKRNFRNLIICLALLIVIAILTEFIGFAFIKWLVIYGFLTVCSYLIFQLIKRIDWNPKFRWLAILPFLLFWIWKYEQKDVIYYYAYENVVHEPVPEKFELIEKWYSGMDEFGDYTAFAVFQINEQNARIIGDKFARTENLDSSLNTPRIVEEYLAKHENLKIVNHTHTRKTEGGWELFGALLSDNKSIIVFDASW